jgi:Fic family protein
MPFKPDRAYNDLPPLPPAQEIETREVLKACITARAALAQMRVAGELIPNQAMLINSLPLLEAQASSEIENIVTTADRLFRFANDPSEQGDAATKEALRYRTALYDGFHMLARRPVSTTMAVEICRKIKGANIDIRATPGTALANSATGAIIYTPPTSEVLRSMLANWESYIHAAKDIDPLIRMAVMHYQFEAIHPFTDGNGRTGRILNILFLLEQGLLDTPILYLSRHIIRRRADYYRLLLAVTAEGNWQSWILYMLEAVRDTADWTTSKIRSIRQLLETTSRTIRERLPKIYSRELAEIIFVQPYCRIGDVVSAGIAKRQSASTYLKALADIGILEERKAGREKLFVNPALLRLLTEEPGAAS